MRPERTILLAVLIAAAGAWLPAAAQSPAAEIRAIEIDAGPDINAADARGLLKLRVGDRCSDEAVDAALRDLWRLGGIRAPEVERVPVEGGIKLIFRLRRPPVVEQIEFAGTPALATDLLRKQLVHPVGAATERGGFDADVQALEEFHRQRGYPLATVRCEAEEKDGAWRVRFVVSSGPRLSVGEVRFEGNRAFSARELARIMTGQKGGLLAGRRYDPRLLEADVAAIAKHYRARGWLDVRLSHRLEYGPSRERVFPVVTIEEGEQYRVEQVVVRGSKVLAAREIAGALQLKPGAAFSEEIVEHDRRTIEQIYGKKGHIGALIEHHLVLAEAGPRVTVEFIVRDEGPAAIVERVDIRNNNVTKDHVIRRYIPVVPGDAVDPSKFESIRRRLLNTGLFSPPDEGGEAVAVYLEEGSTPERKTLVVEVNDDVRGQFRIGAAWNSDFGPAGLIELVHYNFDFSDWPKDWRDLAAGTGFAGGGQQLTVRLAPGTDYSDFRIEWFNPSVNDSAYSFGWDLYADKWRAEEDYDRTRQGISLNVGRRFLDDRFSVTLSPGYEKLKISNVDSSAAADFLAAEGTHNRHVLGAVAAYDTRDNRFDPSRGSYLGLEVTNVGGPLGGDVDAVKERLRGAYHATVLDSPRWGKHVVSVSGALGMMQSTDGDLPFFERWFVGGISENRLRGFEYNGIGPMDLPSGDHVGGEYMALAGAEYGFPLYGKALRGVVFLDAGALARHAGDLDFNSMRVAAGFGFRVRLFGGRLGPIVIDFGFPIRKKSGDETRVLSFSVGGTYRF